MKSKRKWKRVDEGADEANRAKEGQWWTTGHACRSEVARKSARRVPANGKLVTDLHCAGLGLATYHTHSRRAHDARGGKGYSHDEFIAAVMSVETPKAPKTMTTNSFKAEVDVLVRCPCA
eukprot:1075095-Amphidinium_carterae.2